MSLVSTAAGIEVQNKAQKFNSVTETLFDFYFLLYPFLNVGTATKQPGHRANSATKCRLSFSLP